MNLDFDVIIIGAGMSGITAGIRSAMSGKRVLLLEQQQEVGGLNTYYKRAERIIDVGLHAFTNYLPPHKGKGALNKILRQLRIRFEDLKLGEHPSSLISFAEGGMVFGNGPDVQTFCESVRKLFPEDEQRFLSLVRTIENYNVNFIDAKQTQNEKSARQELQKILEGANPLLLEMLLFPCLVYGSSWENDLEFSQFAIMFRALFLEGFARPEGGVKRLIDLLKARFLEEGGNLKLKCKVLSLTEGKAGEWRVFSTLGVFSAKQVISCAGSLESYKLIEERALPLAQERGKLTFTEAIFVLPRSALVLQNKGLPKHSVVFYNERPGHYRYAAPLECTAIDTSSALICFPDNYLDAQKQTIPSEELVIRVSLLANFDYWEKLRKVRADYLRAKEYVLEESIKLVLRYLKREGVELSYLEIKDKIIFHDVFTPWTIRRYGGREGAAVYGHERKSRDGKTPYSQLYLCGSDQGFVGVVGAMLSGIAIANQYVIKDHQSETSI
ncbi:MAG: NAD(P)/FAD-dependent oxidoreductase [Oligoflexia bacterium]|nr:NAD(P)/FAD-dependent oxidoreductase [Oligoflexia bacterium]MBF0366877.1 NAD(P)/FAD-dependent oxidoreductase [Oligoflexia bacterium]